MNVKERAAACPSWKKMTEKPRRLGIAVGRIAPWPDCCSSRQTYRGYSRNSFHPTVAIEAAVMAAAVTINAKKAEYFLVKRKINAIAIARCGRKVARPIHIPAQAWRPDDSET